MFQGAKSLYLVIGGSRIVLQIILYNPCRLGIKIWDGLPDYLSNKSNGQNFMVCFERPHLILTSSVHQSVCPWRPIDYMYRQNARWKFSYILTKFGQRLLALHGQKVPLFWLARSKCRTSLHSMDFVVARGIRFSQTRPTTCSDPHWIHPCILKSLYQKFLGQPKGDSALSNVLSIHYLKILFTSRLCYSKSRPIGQPAPDTVSLTGPHTSSNSHVITKNTGETAQIHPS